MGCYDTVLVPCPKCGEKAEFQSKGGDCLLRTFELSDCPPDVMLDVNRHAPCQCPKCSTYFKVDYKIQVTEAKSVIVLPEEEDEHDY